MDASTASRLKALYLVMQSVERDVGGGEGIEGLYGSITRAGMQKVLDCLTAKCGLGKQSHFVDIGAGLGRPLLHAAVHPGVQSSCGYELDGIKCMKAAAFLDKAVQQLSKKVPATADVAVPLVYCSAIEDVEALEPGTHAYSFWEGVHADGKYAFGKLFSESRTMQSVAIVQHAMRLPEEQMEDFGFGRLQLMGSFPVSMSGSGRSFTAYVFKRGGANKIHRAMSSDATDLLPSTPVPLEEPRREPLGRRPSLDTAAERPDFGAASDGERALLQSTPRMARLSEGDEGGASPQTPAHPTPRKARLAGGETPSRSRPRATPTSAGISGRARRVLLPGPTRQAKGPEGAIFQKRMDGSEGSAEPVEVKHGNAAKSTMPLKGGPRRSARQAAKNAVPLPRSPNLKASGVARGLKPTARRGFGAPVTPSKDAPRNPRKR